MTHRVDIFPKLWTQKNLIRSMPKKSRFKGSFENQHGKWSQTLLKCQGQLLYHIYWSLLRQLSYKKSLLVICKISRLFPNTLSADGKYSLLNRDNLTQPIQMQLSRKQKTFSDFFSASLKCSLYFEYFIKKDDLHSWCISDISDPENPLRSMPRRSRFRGSFKKQHGKRAQTLLKCQGQLVYHIYWSLWRQLSYKKSLLVTCKISKLFPNRVSADRKYSVFKTDNLTQPI